MDADLKEYDSDMEFMNLGQEELIQEEQRRYFDFKDKELMKKVQADFQKYMDAEDKQAAENEEREKE